MKREDRRRAEFFARLASLPQLDGIPTSYAAKLLEDMLQLGYRWLAHDHSISARLRELNPLLSEGELSAENIEGFKQSLKFVALHELHRHARELIGGLLDGRYLDPSRMGPLKRTIIRLDPVSGRIAVQANASDPDPQAEMLVDLVRLIALDNSRFPFARCPVCPTIFVPMKNQKFCSADCLRRANAETRPQKKREYMRDYMRKRRSKQSKLKRPRRKL
jgi:hypothetical protein